MNESLTEGPTRRHGPHVTGAAGAGRAGLPARAVLVRIGTWGALAAALGLTFMAYLDPSLTLDFGAFMALCGLR
jgi:hypothetical protein